MNGLFDQLAAITATADSADGITVTVNLDGQLIGLQLAPQALSLSPSRLGDEIFGLVQEAAATALREGLALVAPVAGADLTAELTSIVDSHPGAPQEVPAPAPAVEDFSQIQTWALPR